VPQASMQNSATVIPETIQKNKRNRELFDYEFVLSVTKVDKNIHLVIEMHSASIIQNFS
jgi:hypothetical protein